MKICVRCEGLGFWWNLDSRKVTCPDCKGKGKTK